VAARGTPMTEKLLQGECHAAGLLHEVTKKYRYV
jgi:hypothetical protein